MPTLTPIDHAAVCADVRTLADGMAADAGWRADLIVGVGRGGLVPAVYLSHATSLPMVSIDASSGLPDFHDALLANLAARAAGGANLLVVEDINDSGRTIAGVRRILADAGAPAARVRFAVLIDNIVSSERVDHAARRIDRRVTKDWFVFPWEAMATAEANLADAAAVPERIA